MLWAQLTNAMTVSRTACPKKRKTHLVTDMLNIGQASMPETLINGGINGQKMHALCGEKPGEKHRKGSRHVVRHTGDWAQICNTATMNDGMFRVGVGQVRAGPIWGEGKGLFLVYNSLGASQYRNVGSSQCRSVCFRRDRVFHSYVWDYKGKLFSAWNEVIRFPDGGRGGGCG